MFKEDPKFLICDYVSDCIYLTLQNVNILYSAKWKIQLFMITCSSESGMVFKFLWSVYRICIWKLTLSWHTVLFHLKH